MTLLSIRDLFATPGPADGQMHDLCNLNLDVGAGAQLALIGDRHAGPSLLAALLASETAHRATIASGTIWCEAPGHGRLMLSQLRARLRDFVLVVPADPTVHFRPRRLVRDQILQGMRRLGWRDRPTALARIQAVLADVGLDDPGLVLEQRPDELGRDAVMAAALASVFACGPRVVIFGTPEITDTVLLAEYAARVRLLARARDIALLTITSQPAVAAEMSDQAAVFYAGRIVEMGATGTLLGTPRHPYTHALIGMQPQMARPSAPFALLEGAAPAPGAVPQGCALHPRCPNAFAGCYIETPALGDQAGQRVACHRPLGEGG